MTTREHGASLSLARAAWHKPNMPPPADPPIPSSTSPAAPVGIDWPAAIVRPPWSDALRWGASLSDVRAVAHGAVDPRPLPPITRWRANDPATVGGLALAIELELELDALVAIELRGRLDALALAALGCTADNADDVGHHRLVVDATRVTVDALDGVVRLEPSEDP